MELLTLDLDGYLTGATTATQTKALADELKNAYSTVGFAYISGWESAVSKELVEEVFQYNERFFKLSPVLKDSLAYKSSLANRGYLSLGREQASLSTDASKIASERAQASDQKESFEIGNDSDPAWPEHWPKECDIPGFKTTMNKFHLACHELNLKIMALLAVALDLPTDFFVSKINERANTLRLLHYPPTSSSGSSSRLGAHTDFGTITLLWQDSCGGLQVTAPDGSWVDVLPRQGSFVINVGDILQRWSNDILKSTIHRAILPKANEDGKVPTRRSVAYFCNPNPSTIIECIPGMGDPKYEKINAGEYYAQALQGEIGV